jgi:hypothetical protein
LLITGNILFAFNSMNRIISERLKIKLLSNQWRHYKLADYEILGY